MELEVEGEVELEAGVEEEVEVEVELEVEGEVELEVEVEWEVEVEGASRPCSTNTRTRKPTTHPNKSRKVPHPRSIVRLCDFHIANRKGKWRWKRRWN